MTLQPGTHINHYVINELIARGGMGVIWKAWDTEQDNAVAIKAVANDLITDPEFKLRIQDEARRHQSLDHPNIVQVLEVFDSGGDTCIVMDLIEGISLDNLQMRKEQKRLKPEEAIPIAQDILRALDYGHRHGIVHRDVKPSNVLLNDNNDALLIDFGIALAMGEERRTQAGKIVGTTLYMSPEQITNPRKIDHRSDVYSVGCVLYEMLTGRTPFVMGKDGIDNTDFSIQQAHVKKKPESMKIHVPDIPSDLDEIVLAALEKDPDKRIPGCGEFLRLLDQTGVQHDDESSTHSYTHDTILSNSGIIIAALIILMIAIILLYLNYP